MPGAFKGLDWVLLTLAAALLLPVPVVFLHVPGTQSAIDGLARWVSNQVLWVVFGASPMIGLGCLAMVTVRRWGRWCFEWMLGGLGVVGGLWAAALGQTPGIAGAFSGLFIAVCGTCVSAAAVVRKPRSSRGFPVSVPVADASTEDGSR
jgi:hypothetical protein